MTERNPRLFSRLVLWLWSCASALILAYGIYLQHFLGGGEIMAIPLFLAFAVNFPISNLSVLLVALVYMGLSAAGLPDDQYPLLRYAFEWFVLTASGYIQWFVLLPMAWRKLKAKATA